MRRLFLIGMALLTAPAAAQEAASEGGEQPFFIRGGVLFGDVRTALRVDATNVAGTTVSLERDLGLRDRPAIPFVEAGYRFAPRWRVTFEYLSVGRSASASISRPLQIGETLYDTSARLDSSFRSDLYKVQLGWSPLKTANAELGVSVGAHITDFSASVQGAGTVNGQSFTTRRETRSVLAPLPNIGAFGVLRLGGPFTLTGRANYLQLRIDDVEGGLTDLEAAINWQVHRNIALSAGYRSLDYRLDVAQSNFAGNVRYRFRGPVLAVMATF